MIFWVMVLNDSVERKINNNRELLTINFHVTKLVNLLLQIFSLQI